MNDDTKDVLMQFLGQTYGELHKIDTMITGESQHLQQRSGAFKNVVSDILTNQVPNIPQSPRISAPYPVQLHTNNVQLEPGGDATSDPNQLEFTFLKPEDTRSIAFALQRIEDKVERLDKKLSKLLDTKKS